MRPRFEIGVIVILSIMLVAWSWPAVQRIQRKHALVNRTAAIAKDIEQWTMERELHERRLQEVDGLVKVNAGLKEQLEDRVTRFNRLLLEPERKQRKSQGRT